MWRLVGASVVGTSHVANQIPCQDSNWATPGDPESPWPGLCMFASDGAGSASHGGEGAELAVETIATFLRNRGMNRGFVPTGSLFRECVIEVREKIRREAEAKGLTPRDFACTLLGLISTESNTAIMQIGDGGVVVDFGEGLKLPIIPMNGEYANSTYFVTDEDSLERLATHDVPARAVRAAVFTDGIQRLCVSMARNEPHEPFFRQMFSFLEASASMDQDRLGDELVAFLNSDAVCERTDDDRTLLLAAEVPG